MGDFPHHQYNGIQYVPAHLLHLAYQQKNNPQVYNPAPQAWMNRYLHGAYGNRFNVSNQLGMVIPNVRPRLPGNSSPNVGPPRLPGNSSLNVRPPTRVHQMARKRQRNSPGPHSPIENQSFSFSETKKQRLESPRLPTNVSNAPSTSTKPPGESEVQTTTSVPGTSTSNSINQTRSESPSLDKQIASAVESELTSKESPKRKTPQRTPDPASRKGTDTTQSTQPSKSSRKLSEPSIVTPPIRSAVKRNADAAALAKSAPATTTKYARRDVEGNKREPNSATLLDTPTSSKANNNQRRNSLPALVKDTLADQILNRYEQTKQRDADLQRKEEMRVQLENIIHEVMPYTMLFLVGSSRNCFGSRTSDADMCLMVTDGEMNQKRDAKNILYQLQRYLRERCRFIRNMKVIPAKVPIIKFNHKYSGLECDLNVNNATGIRNTHLLQSYAKLDNRVSPLVLMVKQWASHNDINDASQGTLSSYSLVLMVLNYLQVKCKPPVIPALQQRYSSTFNKFIDVRQLYNTRPNTPLPNHVKFKSENKEDVGSLFRGFFDYYSKFDFATRVMSVRSGNTLHVNQVAKNGGDWLNKYILIEEPFDLTNTARAVYSIDNFIIIQKQLRETNRKFKHDDGRVMKLGRVCGSLGN